MTKTDIQSAFRIIPVHPQDWELLGMSWQGRYYFDKVLPFGLHSAPFLFNQLSDALEWLVNHHLNIHSVIHILDDFFLVQPPPASHCATALCQVLTLFEELNIPIAPKKTFSPSTTLEFMGITLDSVLMQARLPGDKLLKARAMLSSWSHKRSCYLLKGTAVPYWDLAVCLPCHFPGSRLSTAHFSTDQGPYPPGAGCFSQQRLSQGCCHVATFPLPLEWGKPFPSPLL